MRIIHITLALVLLFGFNPQFSRSTDSPIYALAYHDVVDTREELASDSVTLETLINHFEWLLVAGYHPVSVDDLLAARDGKISLPEKPVLLCWDDGYSSFYSHVFPLLQAYKFPAVLALVGNWMSADPEDSVVYGDNLVSRKKFLSWDQITELSASGLVEIASHSMNLHHGVLASPWGDRLPAIIAPQYNPQSHKYESDEEYNLRIHDDLLSNNLLIEKHTGKRPRVLVWPFGRYNEVALKIAKSLGFKITLTLNPVASYLDSLDTMGRIYPTMNPAINFIRGDMKEKSTPPLLRFIKVDMVNLDEATTTGEENFSKLLDRVQTLQVGGVAFEPIVTRTGNPVALFPNSYINRIEDRLLRLLWATSRRGGADSLLWLNQMIFDLEKTDQVPESPNSFFGELGKSAPANGVIIDYNSFAEDLLKFFITLPADKRTGLREQSNRKRKNRQTWLAQTKDTGYLPSRVLSCIEKYQKWQPYQTVSLVLSPKFLSKLTENQLSRYLAGFDYLIVNLNHKEADLFKEYVQENRWITPYLPYLVPLLTFDSADTGSATRIARDFEELTQAGMISHGYSGDDFLHGKPAPQVIRKAIAVSTFPVRPQ